MKKFYIFLLIFFASLLCFSVSAAQNDLIDLREINIDPYTREFISEEEISRKWEEQNRDVSPERLKSLSEKVYKTYSLEEFTQKVRRGLADHLPIIKVILYTNSPIKDLTNQLKQAEREHTGKPDEGDYIYWNCEGWSYTSSYTINGSSGYKYEYIITFKVTYRHSQDQETAAAREFAAVSASLKPKGISDIEKIRAIYDYLSKNVRYDFKNLYNDSYKLKYSSYSAIVQKSTVCLGFATSMYRLLLMNGIDARVVVSGPGNHAWNIVKVGDKWYHLDVTWASNDINDNNYPAGAKDYFMKSYANIQRHDSKKGEHVVDLSAQRWISSYLISNRDYGNDINVSSLIVNGVHSLDAGNSANFTVTVRPSNATNKNVEWTVTENNKPISYAKITNTGRLTLSVDAAAGKTLLVTAKAKDGSNITGTMMVKIKQPDIKNLYIRDNKGTNITDKTITTNTKEHKLLAAAEPSNASMKFTWKSSDITVASVDTAGKVLFKKAGTVTITVTASDSIGNSARVKIVYSPLVSKVVIYDPSGADISEKSITVKTPECQLKAAAEPSDASQKFKWESSNTDIASVNSSGMVFFKKNGTVTVTVSATDGSGKFSRTELTYGYVDISGMPGLILK